uniref:Proline-rich transmembrane protein 3/4 domain-containing protein n=2 Tax=Timema TaxID=61471 RepID=A0A7R8VFF8_TIMDO|nr:unnamed protein product [Timema douglasi]
MSKREGTVVTACYARTCVQLQGAYGGSEPHVTVVTVCYTRTCVQLQGAYGGSEPHVTVVTACYTRTHVQLQGAYGGSEPHVTVVTACYTRTHVQLQGAYGGSEPHVTAEMLELLTALVVLVGGASTAPPPPTTIPPFAAPHTIFPPAFTTPSGRRPPSYVPPIRASFTPPLPPGYGNPFADKPTLRGSNSDGALLGVGGGRHPVPPPPRPPQPRERIPLRPPDLVVSSERDSAPPDRKKPLNTPSFNRSPEAPLGELEILGVNARPANDTDFNFDPLLHQPSVSRILSGSNGRRQELPDILRRPDSFPKIHLDVLKKDPPQPPPPPPVIKPEAEPPKTEKTYDPVVKNTASENVEVILGGELPLDLGSIITGRDEQVERLPAPQPQPPKNKETSVSVADSPSQPETATGNGVLGRWRFLWDLHVYLTAGLFTALAVCALVNIVRVNVCKRLMSRGYHVTLHVLLLSVGVLRSFYLFYDAYNLNDSFPEPVSRLLLNAVSPLISSVFVVLFLFLLQAAHVNVLSVRLQRPALAGSFSLAHVALCAGLDAAAGAAPFLPLVCQSLFIAVCLCLGLAYLYAFRLLTKAAVRKQEDVFGGGFTSVKRRPALVTAVNVTLAAAVCALLLASVQLYGIFGLYRSLHLPESWQFWGYHLCVRLLELAVCFLLYWAGVQPPERGPDHEEKGSQSSGFALFRCGGACAAGTPQSSEAADDIYPAVCVTNQAIHDYTARTGKKVYDDAFPLSNFHSGGGGGYARPDSNLSLTTGERRSLRKSPYPAGSTAERRSVKKNGQFDVDKPEYDLTFSASNELRHSVRNSETLIPLNSERPDSVYPLGGTAERRSLKRTVDPSFGVGRSLKKSDTLASLGSDRDRRAVQPANQHRGGSQTLAPARASPSMLVAENGFVRFRALGEPGECLEDREEPPLGR